MCKKLMFLISLVSVLVLASSALAADYHWDGDSPWSLGLWVDPCNWEEGVAPDDCGDRAYIGSTGHNPTVVITTIEVEEVRGPAWDATADHELLLVWDANLTVCNRWRVEETLPYTAYITLIDRAKVRINGRFVAHGDDQSVVIDLSDDTEFYVRDDLRAGDEEEDYFELNMTDRAYLYAGNDDDGFRHNDGELHVSVSGNAILEAEYIRWRSKSDGLTCTLDVIENAQVIVNDDDFRFAGGSSDFIINVTDNAGMDIDGDWKGGEDNDFDATWTLNMPCGDSPLITMNGDLRMIDDDEASGFGQINLYGGTINVGEELRSDTDNWNIDICCNGVLILGNNVEGDVWDWHDSGHITACGFGPCGGPADLMVDYNNVNVGKTTVWIVMSNRAWDPYPPCDEEDVPCDICLSWEAGSMVEQHFVFLSTDINKLTTPGDMSALVAILPAEETTYCPEIPTTLSLTYYWRVDEVWDCGTTTGQVWSFTKVHCMPIDDFESYTDDDVDPDQVFYTWLDGAGDAGGVGGNGTGSSVYLVHNPVHCGENAMEYQYDSTGSEREMGYSEAERAFDPPLDLTDQGETLLAIWFYGDPTNIVDQETDPLDTMWFEVGANGNVARTPYGIYGSDGPADLQSAAWQVWVMSLATEFGVVDLSQIDSMAIGFGQYGRPGAQGIAQTGTVFFDCLQYCEDMCVDEWEGKRRYAPDGDLNHDCIVDEKDLEMQVDDWLEDKR